MDSCSSQTSSLSEPGSPTRPVSRASSTATEIAGIPRSLTREIDHIKSLVSRAQAGPHHAEGSISAQIFRHRSSQSEDITHTYILHELDTLKKRLRLEARHAPKRQPEDDPDTESDAEDIIDERDEEFEAIKDELRLAKEQREQWIAAAEERVDKLSSENEGLVNLLDTYRQDLKSADEEKSKVEEALREAKRQEDEGLRSLQTDYDTISYEAKTAHATVTELSSKLEDSETTHKDNLERLQSERDTSQRRLVETEGKLKAKLAEVASRLVAEAKENRSYRDQAQKGEKAHADRVKDLQNRVSELEEQSRISKEHAQQVSSLLETRKREVEAAELHTYQLQKDHDAALVDLRGKHDEERQSVESRAKIEIEQLREDHSATTAKLESSHQEALGDAHFTLSQAHKLAKERQIEQEGELSKLREQLSQTQSDSDQSSKALLGQLNALKVQHEQHDGERQSVALKLETEIKQLREDHLAKTAELESKHQKTLDDAQSSLVQAKKLAEQQQTEHDGDLSKLREHLSQTQVDSDQSNKTLLGQLEALKVQHERHVQSIQEEWSAKSQNAAEQHQAALQKASEEAAQAAQSAQTGFETSLNERIAATNTSLNETHAQELERVRQGHRKELEELQSLVEAAQEELGIGKAQTKDLHTEREKIASEHQVALLELRTENQTAAQRLREEHETAMLKAREELDANHSKERNDLKTANVKEREELEAVSLKEREEHKAALFDLRAENQAAALKLREEHEIAIRKVCEELEAVNLKERNELEATSLKELEQHKAALSELRAENQAATLKLREEHEAAILREREELEATNLKEREEREATHLKEREELEAINLRERKKLEAANLKQREELEAINLQQREDHEVSIQKEREQLKAANLEEREELKATNVKEREMLETTNLRKREELEAVNLKVREDYEAAILKARAEHDETRKGFMEELDQHKESTALVEDMQKHVDSMTAELRDIHESRRHLEELVQQKTHEAIQAGEEKRNGDRQYASLKREMDQLKHEHEHTENSLQDLQKTIIEHQTLSSDETLRMEKDLEALKRQIDDAKQERATAQSSVDDKWNEQSELARQNDFLTRQLSELGLHMNVPQTPTTSTVDQGVQTSPRTRTVTNSPTESQHVRNFSLPADASISDQASPSGFHTPPSGRNSGQTGPELKTDIASSPLAKHQRYKATRPFTPTSPDTKATRRTFEDYLHHAKAELSELGSVISANETLFAQKIQEHVGDLQRAKDVLAQEYKDKFDALLADRERLDKKVTADQAAEFVRERDQLLASYEQHSRGSETELPPRVSNELHQAEQKLVHKYNRRIATRKSQIRLQHAEEFHSLTQDYDRRVANMLHRRTELENDLSVDASKFERDIDDIERTSSALEVERSSLQNSPQHLKPSDLLADAAEYTRETRDVLSRLPKRSLTSLPRTATSIPKAAVPYPGGRDSPHATSRPLMPRTPSSEGRQYAPIAQRSLMRVRSPPDGPIPRRTVTEPRTSALWASPASLDETSEQDFGVDPVSFEESPKGLKRQPGSPDIRASVDAQRFTSMDAQRSGMRNERSKRHSSGIFYTKGWSKG